VLDGKWGKGWGGKGGREGQGTAPEHEKHLTHTCFSCSGAVLTCGYDLIHYEHLHHNAVIVISP